MKAKEGDKGESITSEASIEDLAMKELQAKYFEIIKEGKDITVQDLVEDSDFMGKFGHLNENQIRKILETNYSFR